MFDDIPLISLSVKILKYESLLYKRNWRCVVVVSLMIFLVFTQFVYMFRTKEGIDAIIRNSYMLVLWFNTILRGIVLLYDHHSFEELISVLKHYYYVLKTSDDPYVQELLEETNIRGKYMMRGNLFLGFATCVGFGLYPLFSSQRVLPFGSMIPGINEYESPYYEIIYVYHMVVTPMGCCMYIPYTSLIVAFIMFGITMCKLLQHRLRTFYLIKNNNKNDDSNINHIITECIIFQKNIISYISAVNRLTSYIFLIEFLAFGALLCALLFLLIIVNSNAQALFVCVYITMIIAQIFALYWYANELRHQYLAVADAAYEMPWFSFHISIQKHILLLILRAQKPCSVKLGNTYPMTLELFQSLLNASYTYFTLLKRVYR